jgi:small-conductance mechanosensitive channel
MQPGIDGNSALYLVVLLTFSVCLLRVIMGYVYYEACQIAFSLWLYDIITPGQVELWLFAIMML